MGTIINASWTPPPASWLTYTDCTAATAWLAAMASGIADNTSTTEDVPDDLTVDYFLSLVPDVPAGLTVEYFLSLVPFNWTTPTNGEVMMWYMDDDWDETDYSTYNNKRYDYLRGI